MISVDPPGDEMTNILSRLPVKDLMKFSHRISQEFGSSPVQLPDFPVHAMFGFGCVPPMDEYKVVRILYSEEMNLTDPPKLSHVVEIYSLKTDSWAKIEIGLSYFVTSVMTKAFLDGSAYWVARKANETENYDFIVSFNMADHAFKEIKLPKSCLNDGEFTGWLAVFRDSLHLFVHGPESVDRWHIRMMEEDCSGKIWCHQFKIDCSSEICWPVCFMKNGEVIFESTGWDLSLYDPRNQQFQDIHFQRNLDMIELFPYKESLALLDLGTKSWPRKLYDDENEEVESQTQSQESFESNETVKSI